MQRPAGQRLIPDQPTSRRRRVLVLVLDSALVAEGGAAASAELPMATWPRVAAAVLAGRGHRSIRRQPPLSISRPRRTLECAATLKSCRSHPVPRPRRLPVPRPSALHCAHPRSPALTRAHPRSPALDFVYCTPYRNVEALTPAPCTLATSQQVIGSSLLARAGRPIAPPAPGLHSGGSSAGWTASCSDGALSAKQKIRDGGHVVGGRPAPPYAPMGFASNARPSCVMTGGVLNQPRPPRATACARVRSPAMQGDASAGGDVSPWSVAQRVRKRSGQTDTSLPPPSIMAPS